MRKNAKEHLRIFDLFPRYSNVRYHSLCLVVGNSSFQYSIIQVVSENNPIDQGINTTIQGIHHSSLESFDPTPPTPCVCFSRQSKSHYYSQKKIKRKKKLICLGKRNSIIGFQMRNLQMGPTPYNLDYM